MIGLKDWLGLLKHLVVLTFGYAGAFQLAVMANKLVGSNSNLNIAFGIFLFIVAMFLGCVLFTWLREFWLFLCKLIRKLFNLYD